MDLFGLQINGFKLLLIYSNFTTKNLKNKAVLSLNAIVCIAMWSLVTYSKCFVIYCRLMPHGSTIKVCFIFRSV